MFVIMDMEWVYSYGGVACPTQIAAIRTDRYWRKKGTFSSLIRPRDKTCYRWSQEAYTGAEKEFFLAAPSGIKVFRDLFNWFRDDDILLWWDHRSVKAFQGAVQHMLGQDVFHKIKELDTIVGGTCGDGGDAYHLARNRGIATPGVSHISTNDTEAIRALLEGIHLRESSIIKPQENSSFRQYETRYFLDPETKLLHLAGEGCMKTSPFGFSTVKSCLRKGLRPCPVCCKEDFRRESMKLTADVISRSDYNFIYSPKSNIFHKAECGHARRMRYTDVRGSVNYSVCADTGRRPCRLCNPEPFYIRSDKIVTYTYDAPEMPVVPKARPIPGLTRVLNASEQRAYDRHIAATKERLALKGDDAPNSVYKRSCSSYVFWAERGYGTFHTCDCPKLETLDNIEGFSLFSDAIRKGFRPCKFCRPKQKQELRISVPSGGRIRPGETTEILDHLCDEYGYAHHMDGALYFISTPVGKWRLNTAERPVDLWHINLTNQRSPDYHKQPRLLLSLSDTFWYIYRHDNELLDRQPAVDDLDDLMQMIDTQMERLIVI